MGLAPKVDTGGKVMALSEQAILELRRERERLRRELEAIDMLIGASDPQPVKAAKAVRPTVVSTGGNSSQRTGMRDLIRSTLTRDRGLTPEEVVAEIAAKLPSGEYKTDLFTRVRNELYRFTRNGETRRTRGRYFLATEASTASA